MKNTPYICHFSFILNYLYKLHINNEILLGY